MKTVALKVDRELHRQLWMHLLPKGSDCEEAAFVFARAVDDGRSVTFEPVDKLLVGPDGFVVRSPRFLELRDEVRAGVIKHAHGLGASVIEFHSHPRYTAEFSWSDKAGLREFVPHVRWRLKQRPYGAIVVAPNGFDALFWIDNSTAPVVLNQLDVEGQILRPTGWSFKNWEVDDHEYPI